MKKLGPCVDREGTVADLYTDGEKYYRENPRRLKKAIAQGLGRLPPGRGLRRGIGALARRRPQFYRDWRSGRFQRKLRERIVSSNPYALFYDGSGDTLEEATEAFDTAILSGDWRWVAYLIGRYANLGADDTYSRELIFQAYKELHPDGADAWLDWTYTDGEWDDQWSLIIRQLEQSKLNPREQKYQTSDSGEIFYRGKALEDIVEYGGNLYYRGPSVSHMAFKSMWSEEEGRWIPPGDPAWLDPFREGGGYELNPPKEKIYLVAVRIDGENRIYSFDNEHQRKSFISEIIKGANVQYSTSETYGDIRKMGFGAKLRDKPE